MASSVLVPDFPAVAVALEHLKELEKQLKEEGRPPEACLHLEEITAAVTELEADRRAAHEHLEVATIENSKLRHQLNHTREQISQDIMADVVAARASNTEEIEQLHRDLLAASQLQEAAVKSEQVLLVHNKALYVEREQVKVEHEEAVAALNREITQKYALQMQLDQTKEKIKDLQSVIMAVEEDKETLQRNTLLETDAFAMCKDNLTKEMSQVDEKMKQQKQEMRKIRRELWRVEEKKREVSEHLDDLGIQLAKLEGNVRRLTASRCQYEKHLEAEVCKYQEQTTQRETLTMELCELSEAFPITMQQLKNDTAAVEEQIKVGCASRIQFQDALAQVGEVFKHQHEEEYEVRVEHSHISQQLEKSKSLLEERVASIVRYRKELKEMDMLIGELVEAETINRHVFERNQGELCGSVDTEKENVSHYEKEAMQLKQLLQEEMKQQEEHIAKMTSDISKTRRRYEELQQEEASLHQHQPLSTDHDLLMSHIIQCEADYKETENTQRKEIEKCGTEIESVTMRCEEKQKEAEETEELLKEVEARWTDAVSRHGRLETLTSGLREKRNDLEVCIEGLKLKTHSLLEPKEQKKKTLEATRASYMELLDKQASELRCIELCIYDSRVKLEQVGMENSRLQLHIQQMTEEITRAGQDRDRYRQEMQQLSHDTNALCESLQDAWRQDLLLTQDRQSRDGVVLTSMTSLLHHLKTRRHRLGDVSTLLHQQMLDFSRRLGDRATAQHKT